MTRYFSLIVIAFLLDACSPTRFTDKVMQPFEGGGKYAYDRTAHGITVYSAYEIRSFPPHVSRTADRCRRIIEQAHNLIETSENLALEPQPYGEVEISSTYEGGGWTACNGRAYYQNLKQEKPRRRRIVDLPEDGAPVTYPFARGPENPDALAVLVGNRHYRDPDIPEVRYAYNDVAAMHQFLVKTMGYRPDRVFILKDATKADLDAYFGTKTNPDGRLADKIRPGQSEVFVYYSGHGIPGADGRGSLLPSDGHAAESRISTYDSQVLIDNINKARPHRAVVMLDTCFSGLSDAGAVIQNASPVYVTATLPGKLDNGVILSAAAGNQIASWDRQAHLGLFTRYFLEGAAGAADRFGNNDHKVSLGELEHYLREEVAYQARSQFGRRQYPEIATSNQTMTIAPVVAADFPGMASGTDN